MTDVKVGVEMLCTSTGPVQVGETITFTGMPTVYYRVIEVEAVDGKWLFKVVRA